MRIIGTVPVYEDGSAMFYVPANTPLTIQPLDKQGKAVQLMRSWFTAMPGETVSCVGCHEQPKEIPIAQNRLAATIPPSQIKPWYGPPRGLDFERDVQPVLDKYCVSCHNGQERAERKAIADLRSERHFKDYSGRQLTKLGANRLHPTLRKALGGTNVFYTPAYEALIPYIRRVNVEDHVGLLTPGEYHADTSELIQMLNKGHYNIQLDKESWDRLITWIDLNGPCHGTWSDVGPIPERADKRRRELNHLYGGPKYNPERIPQILRPSITPIKPEWKPETKVVHTAHLSDLQSKPPRLIATEKKYKTIEMDKGIEMKLVRVPAGNFFMGDLSGEPDEYPITHVSINRDFWMGSTEVTNEQYHLFDPTHNSGYFTKRFQGPDGPGLSLTGPNHPVVRVSWEQALAFCDWVSKKTGLKFTLPTEAQWEYACRSGSNQPLSYGDLDTDFSSWANVADKSLSLRPGPTGGLESNIVAHFGKGILESAVFGGNVLCDLHYDDGNVATAEVGSYQPNLWGLYDMHGNTSEWTRTTYKPYPYNSDDGRDDPDETGEKVVRGGSWCDRPKRCRSAFRLSYPIWQRVHNVGFRVVCEINTPQKTNIISAKDINFEVKTN
jgi:formylglycine-generating enzyme required for sulfatase activity